MSIAVLPARSVRRSPRYFRFGAALSTLVGTVAIILTETSTEPALAVMSLGVIIVGAKLLWRSGEPPILFGAFFIQWLQATMAVFRASFSGVELASLYSGYSGVGDGIVTATWLSLFGLLVLAGGIRLALRGIPAVQTEFITEIQQCSLKKAFGAYCLAQVACVGIESVTYLFPGFVQALISLTNFRWLFFFMLAIIVFVKRRGYLLLTFVCLFEIARGFLSYYSDYKDAFLVVTMAFLTARPELNIRTLAGVSLIATPVIVLSAAWSEVKTEYRSFLNAGTGQQYVVVGPVEAFNRISELLLDKGMSQLSEGFDDLSRRIEYTYLFGRVVEHVPSMFPHDDGAIWSGAVMHVLTPRLLFPDKPSIGSDVLNTQRYAGLKITEQGGQATEIPMGYMAESYIDFGSLGMFVPILLLGLLYGGQYRYIVTRRRYMILAIAAAPVLMMPMSKFETTAAKILGGTLTTFGVFVVAFSVLAPKFYSMLQAVPAAKRAPPASRASGNNF
jgi:hypothetical protein